MTSNISRLVRQDRKGAIETQLLLPHALLRLSEPAGIQHRIMPFAKVRLKTSQLQGQFDDFFANGAGRPKSALICESGACLQGTCNQPDMATWVGIGAAKWASRRSHLRRFGASGKLLAGLGQRDSQVSWCRASH
jgi:hypothetical protein